MAWTTGRRTLEDKYVSAAIGAAELVRKGCTAAYDMFAEFPLPTADGVDAVARAYTRRRHARRRSHRCSPIAASIKRYPDCSTCCRTICATPCSRSSSHRTRKHARRVPEHRRRTGPGTAIASGLRSGRRSRIIAPTRFSSSAGISLPSSASASRCTSPNRKLQAIVGQQTLRQKSGGASRFAGFARTALLRLSRDLDR